MKEEFDLQGWRKHKKFCWDFAKGNSNHIKEETAK